MVLNEIYGRPPVDNLVCANATAAYRLKDSSSTIELNIRTEYCICVLNI